MDKSLAGFREWLGLDDLPDNPKILKSALKLMAQSYIKQTPLLNVTPEVDSVVDYFIKEAREWLDE